MTNKTEKREILDLFIRINSIAQPLFDNSNAEKVNTSLDAKKIIHLSRAAAFCPDPLERKSLQNELDSLINPETETVGINFTFSEILLISKALILFMNSKDAEEFIEKSYGDSNIKNTRWAQVAEMMFLKKPNEKFCKDRRGELIDYCNLVNSGIEPREASEKVYKKTL